MYNVIRARETYGGYGKRFAILSFVSPRRDGQLHIIYQPVP